MPIFAIGLDDGRKLHIDADDQDAALAGAQHFLRTTPPPQNPSGPSGLWQTFRVSDSPDAVQINANAIKSARDQGYSDQQIADHLVQRLTASGNGTAAQPNYYPKPSSFTEARDAGYSDDQIVQHLAQDTRGFGAKVQEALKQGYTPAQIMQHLSGPDVSATPHGPWEDYKNLPPLPPDYQLEDGPWRDFQTAQSSDAKRPMRFDDLPKTPKFDDLPPIPNGYQLERPAQQEGTTAAPVTAGGVAKAVGAGALSGVVGLPGDFVALTNLARRG